MTDEQKSDPSADFDIRMNVKWNEYHHSLPISVGTTTFPGQTIESKSTKSMIQSVPAE